MAEFPTLVLVCKRPMLGFGKQRLAASLGVEMAQQVAAALLNCALEDARSWDGPVVIAPSSEADVAWATTLLPQTQFPVRVQPQVVGNLGQRLNALDVELRHKGMETLVFIGSDAPGLAKADYAVVRDALQCHDTVLMPALDGGIVLMASGCPWPSLTVLPWSSGQLGAALAGCCRGAGQSVATLYEGFDVDELADLTRSAIIMADDLRPARRALYQLTVHIMAMREGNEAF
ncbi:MAG: DUF2064 domain-containing protein [Nitrosomonas sp.]|nr:DUF2064 domain-containing protein [Nitrosomonas sp.]MDP1950601.1 DUF2064 domain-containing protein [Nitrosomonas sp.]